MDNKQKFKYGHKVSDCNLVALWKCNKEECECKNEDEAYIAPTFYEENGTPICTEGNDMSYIETRLILEIPSIPPSDLKNIDSEKSDNE